MTLDEAKAVLESLGGKLSDARKRHTETQIKAKELAYPANTGDQDARKKLDKLDADAAKQALEILSLEAATATATRHVEAAMEADADAVAREKAQQAMALLDDFAKRGSALDAKLAEFVAEYEALSADFRKLDALGFAPTSFALVKINMAAAVTTRLQFTDIRQALLAPDQRREFRDVIESRSRNIRAKATARLNRNAPAKAA